MFSRMCSVGALCVEGRQVPDWSSRRNAHTLQKPLTPPPQDADHHRKAVGRRSPSNIPPLGENTRHKLITPESWTYF